MAKTRQSQLDAVKRWKVKNKDRIHQVKVEFHDSKDPELWAWLTSQKETKGIVIRRLIREEIERTDWHMPTS